MSLSYGTIKTVNNILKIKFDGRPSLDHHEIFTLFDEYFNNFGLYAKGGEVIKQQSEHRRIFEGFVEYLLYRNLANYDSMILLTADKGTGKSSFAIMVAYFWCKLLGIKFDPDRHMAYTNAQVMDKIDKLKPFEPLICTVFNTKITIKNKKGQIQKIKIGELAKREIDYEVKSYNIKEDKFEWVKPEKCVQTGFTDDIYEIELEDGKKIKVTSDHKIYTKNGYKKAIDLTENDEIVINTNNCIVCGKEYILNNKNNTRRKYCSKKCDRIENNRMNRELYKTNIQFKVKRLNENKIWIEKNKKRM